MKIQSGHAYAFGLGARFGAPYDAQIRAKGYAMPEEPQRTEFGVRGWWPVVIYPAKSAPVTAPEPGAQYIVVAFRSGASVAPRSAWPWSSIMPIAEMRWMLDLSPGVVG